MWCSKLHNRAVLAGVALLWEVQAQFCTWCGIFAWHPHVHPAISSIHKAVLTKDGLYSAELLFQQGGIVAAMGHQQCRWGRGEYRCRLRSAARAGYAALLIIATEIQKGMYCCTLRPRQNTSQSPAVLVLTTRSGR